MSNTVNFEVEKMSTPEMLAQIALLRAKEKMYEADKDVSQIINQIQEEASYNLEQASSLVRQNDFVNSQKNADAFIQDRSTANEGGSGNHSSSGNGSNSGGGNSGGSNHKTVESPSEINQISLSMFDNGQVDQFLTQEGLYPIPIMDPNTLIKLEDMKREKDKTVELESSLMQEVERQKQQSVAVVDSKRVEDIINNIDRDNEQENQRSY